MKTGKRFAQLLLCMLTAVLGVWFTVAGVHADTCASKAEINAEATAVHISVTNVEAKSSFAGVEVQVYYSGDSVASGTTSQMTYDKTTKVWGTDVEFASLDGQRSGTYYYNVFGRATGGNASLLASGSFEVPLKPVVTGSDANGTNNTFKATVTGLETATSVTKVTLNVTAANKAAYTYTASRQNDGTYQAVVKTANHKYYWGNYTIKATVQFSDGTTAAAESVYNFNPQNYFRTGSTGDSRTRIFYASNLTVKGSKVTYELWSKTNGRDDVSTYTATKNGNLYSATINLSKLKHAGTAYVRVKVDGKQTGSDYTLNVSSDVITKNGWYYETYNGSTYKFYYKNGVKQTDVSSLVSKSKLYIEVNRAACVATVYAYDTEKKFYCIPVKAFTVSVGKDVSSTKTNKGLTRKSSFTPLGTYSVSSNGVAVKYSLKTMNEPDGSKVYSRWATHVVGNIYFHAVAVSKKSHTALNYKNYNKLGSPASAGCIRMTVADAKWIYDNVKTGTKVKIVKGTASKPGPLGKPATIKIKSSKVKYDPTDPAISDATKQKDYKAGRISGYMKKNGTKVGY
jgi:hypothetical protein